MKIIYKLILLVLISSNTYAADINERLKLLFGKSEPYEEFHNNLINYLNINNKQNISQMIHYPLKVNKSGIKIEYANKDEFIKNYESIFTKKIKTVVLNQSFNALFSNYQGIMYGSGSVWAAEVCSQASTKDTCVNMGVGIITVNKP